MPNNFVTYVFLYLFSFVFAIQELNGTPPGTKLGELESESFKPDSYLTINVYWNVGPEDKLLWTGYITLKEA